MQQVLPNIPILIFYILYNEYKNITNKKPEIAASHPSIPNLFEVLNLVLKNVEKTWILVNLSNVLIFYSLFGSKVSRFSIFSFKKFCISWSGISLIVQILKNKIYKIK